MEIKAKLLKPFTESEKVEFIVTYNHNQGCVIEETETALTAKSYSDEEQLAKAKEAKYNEANQGARDYLESGNALFELEEGKNIEATDGNIGKLSAYALGFITGQLRSQDVVYWNTKEDETISLTQEHLTQALTGLGQVQALVWNVKFPAYITQIEACKTVEEVNAIVIDYDNVPVIDDGRQEDNSEATPSGAEDESSPSSSQDNGGTNEDTTGDELPEVQAESDISEDNTGEVE